MAEESQVVAAAAQTATPSVRPIRTTQKPTDTMIVFTDADPIMVERPSRVIPLQQLPSRAIPRILSQDQPNTGS